MFGGLKSISAVTHRILNRCEVMGMQVALKNEITPGVV
jgi:hypothetical protein